MAVALSQVAAELPGAVLDGDADPEITGLAYDSRRTSWGDLFVCIEGFIKDGHDYAAEAVAKGARALLVQRKLPLEVPQLIVDDSRSAMGRAAAVIYRNPSRALRVIGITGTNGKTTTAYLVKAIMQAAGRRCGLIGTIEQWTGDQADEGARTTPEAADLQRLMRRMVDNGCDCCVMEVSSHGLALHRTMGTEIDVGVFTNLTQDHFDFHHSYEDYRRAKQKLFSALPRGSAKRPPNVAGARDLKASWAVINLDDPEAPHFIEASKAPVITYGLSEGSDIRAEQVFVEADGVSYTARTPQGDVDISLRLTGRFNVYNSLAALSVAVAEGISLEKAAQGMAEAVVPGRFESVRAGQPFSIIVDYAHTPDSLRNALVTARALTQGKVICVFGAGGDRDRSKRSLMGETAAELADYSFVTSDNPRSEDPISICRDVAEGFRRAGTGSYDIVVDRREAIRQAIASASPGDLVLIAGKGHETYQEFQHHKIHFDDREEAERAVRERLNDGTGSV